MPENHVKPRTLLIPALIGALLLSTGCGHKSTAPELHNIDYPEGYATHQDLYGADAFANTLDHPDEEYFKTNDYYNLKSDGSLHILENFETYQQTTEYTCGCATSLMVLNRFGIDEYDEMQLADLLKADTTHGTTVEAIRDFFINLGWDVESHASTDTYFEDPDELKEYLIEKMDADVPVMIDWVDWGGHWQAIIGVDTMDTDSPYDDVIIFADPYDVTDHYQDGYYIYPLGRFFSMWYEGPCTANEEAYQQPFVVAKPLQ